MTHEKQLIDPYRPITKKSNIPAPLTLVIQNEGAQHTYMEGVPSTSVKPDVYVLLSALPEELRNRVITAVQMIRSSL